MSQEMPGRAFHKLTTTRVQCGRRPTDLPLRTECRRQEQRRAGHPGVLGRAHVEATDVSPRVVTEPLSAGRTAVPWDDPGTQGLRETGHGSLAPAYF